MKKMDDKLGKSGFAQPSDFLASPSHHLCVFCRAQETTWQGSAAGASVLVRARCG